MLKITKMSHPVFAILYYIYFYIFISLIIKCYPKSGNINFLYPEQKLIFTEQDIISLNRQIKKMYSKG